MLKLIVTTGYSIFLYVFPNMTDSVFRFIFPCIAKKTTLQKDCIIKTGMFGQLRVLAIRPGSGIQHPPSL